MSYFIDPIIAQKHQTLVVNIGNVAVSLLDEVVKITDDTKDAPGITVKIPVASQKDLKALYDEGHPFIRKSETIEPTIQTSDKKA
jgi:hypothetical protein